MNKSETNSTQEGQHQAWSL